MKVAVIDVGSNTVRLLVAERTAAGLVSVRERRAQVGLGADVERDGEISTRKLDLASELVASYARTARTLGIADLEVLITAPGRQSANGGELEEAITAATGSRARILSAEDEGRLAYAGAVGSLDAPPTSVMVCDVGGGSTQLVFGTKGAGPVWFRSLDLGSLRLTERYLVADPPGKEEVTALRIDIAARLDGLAHPLPVIALAAGGTARGLRRLVGRTLGPDQLRRARGKLRKRPSEKLAASSGLDPARARTLLAGTLVLLELERRLGVPFEVARGGLREGAALDLLAQLEAA